LSEVLYYFLGFAAIYVLMGWALYLPYRVGQLNFLIVSCMAITAYFGGYAAREWSWPFIVILISGILIGAAIAFLFSLAIGDAPCFTVVIVGQASVFIVKTVVENWKILGGTIGFFHIPGVNNMLIIIYSDYLEQLNVLYEKWVKEFTICPTLTIPTDEFDFAQSPEHLKLITQRILQKLPGVDKISLDRTSLKD
jgi:ABC-type branched-subunit amino acid transport system permease subunit